MRKLNGDILVTALFDVCNQKQSMRQSDYAKQLQTDKSMVSRWIRNAKSGNQSEQWSSIWQKSSLEKIYSDCVKKDFDGSYQAANQAMAAAVEAYTGINEKPSQENANPCRFFDMLIQDARKAHDGTTQNKPAVSDNRRLHYYDELWKTYIVPEMRDQGFSQYREFFDSYIEMLPQETDREDRPFEGFRRGSRSLILSPSGLGKTYLLQCLILLQMYDDLKAGNRLSERSIANEAFCQDLLQRFMPDGACFPLMIICRDIHEKGPYKNILQLTQRHVATPQGDFDAWVENAHSGGKLLLLVDAIDEIIDEQTKEDFWEKFDAFIEKHPRTTVVITGRFQDRPLPGYTEYKLSSFSPTEISALAGKLLVSPEDDCEEVLKTIFNNPYLLELARNPYMATVLFSMRPRKNEPLYPVVCLHKICNDIISLRWKSVKSIVDTPTIRKILGFLAWEMIRSQQDGIREEKLVEQITAARDALYENTNDRIRRFSDENIQKFASVIMCSSGILNLDAVGTLRKLVFQNNIICCYFAASHLIDVINSSIPETGRLFEQTAWLLNYIGGLHTPVEFSESLMRVLAIAVSYGGNNLQKFPRWQQKIPLMCLLSMGLSARNASERKLVAQAFADIAGNVYNTNAVTNTDEDHLCSMLLFYFEKYVPDAAESRAFGQCMKKLSASIERSAIMNSRSRYE